MTDKITAICLLLIVSACISGRAGADVWPDGTTMDDWFTQDDAVELSGKLYEITSHGLYPDEGVLRTREFQNLIDKAAAEGGGTIVVTPGIFKIGAVFFRPGVNLHLMPGAVLLGSDDIADYPVVETRMEGQTCLYYPAIVNADHCDGFTISGAGTIDGNGFRAWKAFWQRRKWNRACTNKDEQRARVLYVSNSKNVRVDGVNFQNSMYWTTHFYRCDSLKITNCRFYALHSPDDKKGPSTDGIDLDACCDVTVRNIWISNNDDGIAIKGGKGAFANDYRRNPGNGDNARILIENYTASHGTHSALTLGSECVNADNIVMRNCKVEGCCNVLNLKMRTDTPQHYTNVLVENVTGFVKSNFLLCYPWAQFADLEGRDRVDVKSHAQGVTMRNCEVKCGTFFRTNGDMNVMDLSGFTFENLKITASDPSRHINVFKGVKFENCSLEKRH